MVKIRISYGELLLGPCELISFANLYCNIDDMLFTDRIDMDDDIAKSRLVCFVNYVTIEMADIRQMTFSIAVSWTKMNVLIFKLHWHVFVRVKLTLSCYNWFRYWLRDGQAISHNLHRWWFRATPDSLLGSIFTVGTLWAITYVTVHWVPTVIMQLRSALPR